MSARSRARTGHTTAALVLRRTPYREADLVVTLFTQGLGQVAALARAARKSQRRFGGSLEPFHTLQVELTEAAGADLLTLASAHIETARANLYGHLGAMEAAGKFLGWLRHATPAHTPEPLVWQLAHGCLDQLDEVARTSRAPSGTADDAIRRSPTPTLVLATRGLQLLAASGWRLELEHCVQSGVRCPDGKSAMIDPERGGLVSRSEGGAPFLVNGAVRGRLIEAQEGRSDALVEDDAALALDLVERCMRAHVGLAP
jgi:DNA repair protein RecO (recombination protein O)